MDLFEAKYMSRVMLAQRDNEVAESDNLSEVSESKVCSGEVCGTIWKPSSNEIDLGDAIDQ